MMPAAFLSHMSFKGNEGTKEAVSRDKFVLHTLLDIPCCHAALRLIHFTFLNDYIKPSCFRGFL